MADRPFRFGVMNHLLGGSRSWRDQARMAEDLGYSTLVVPDHFELSAVAAVPAMMAAADATTTLRVGTLVACNDFRHPALLAKEAAVIDLLSEGRLELGLGAGWANTDFTSTGIPLDSAGVRIDRLTESVQVIKGLWADGPLDFNGQHYRIAGLDGSPKPMQRPHPPLLIGGGGARVLTLAAREADIVGVHASLAAGAGRGNEQAGAGPEATDRRIGWVREAAGDRFDQLEISLMAAHNEVTDRPREGAEAIADRLGVSVHEALEAPQILIGSVDALCDRLEEMRERWSYSYIVLLASAIEMMAPVVARLAGR